ncbi:MAG: cytochrome P450 [Chloroflexi bacterium]|nr:cytochrome P450 [Chloroflexota bacterium]
MVNIKHTSLSSARQRPPGPARGFPGHHLFAWRRHPLDFLLTMAQQYGDIVTLPLGRQPVILLNHPDFIRQVLVSEHTRFAGAQMLPAGCRRWEGVQLTNADAELMVREAAAMAQSWQQGVVVDVAQAMATLSLRIAGRTLFATDLTPDLPLIQRSLDDLITLGDPLGISLFVRASPRRWRRARAHLDALVSRLPAAPQAQKTPLGATLDDAAIQTQALSLLLAAYEAPANALTWTWYLLAQHPQVWSRLRLELAQVLGDRLPTAEDLPRLRFTAMVLAEATRLYPPVWLSSRQALQAHQIGGYALPAGTTLLLSPWVMHRDPRYFTEPLAFWPERWQAESDTHTLPYFPCGNEAHVGMGASLVRRTGILLLATLAQRWHLRLPSGHATTLQPGLTLRPRHGLPMIPTPAEVTP